MRKKLFFGKSSRTKIFTVITVVAIVLLIALNLGLNYFSVFDTVFLDMTPERLYTLRPVMVNALNEIFLDESGKPNDTKINITFCADPDSLINSVYTRVVYFMARDMESKFGDNVSVTYENVIYNPTAVAMYKTTSLTEINPDDVIISCGGRYRVLDAKSFWRIGSKSVIGYDGEYKMASVIMSLTLVNRPAAYFVTDLNDPADPLTEEKVKVGYFADLLSECGMEVKTLSLASILEEAERTGATPAIPEDCILLIMNNPVKDLSADPDKFSSLSYVSESELVDRFLTEGKGSLIVAKDYKVDLPNLEALLSEWGMKFSDTLVLDTENCIETDGVEGSSIVGVYSTDENSYAYSIYEEFVTLSSAPRMIISDTGHIECSWDDSQTVNESGTHRTNRVFAPFIFSSEKSIDYAKNETTGAYVDRAGNEGARALAAICGRQYLDANTGNYTNSYVFCAAGGDFFSDEALGNATYANFDVLCAAFRSIARLDTYASDELGGLSANNTANMGGKLMISTVIGEEESKVAEYYEDGTSAVVKINHGLITRTKVIYAIVFAIVPLTVAIIGVTICVRRKFL